MLLTNIRIQDEYVPMMLLIAIVLLLMPVALDYFLTYRPFLFERKITQKGGDGLTKNKTSQKKNKNRGVKKLPYSYYKIKDNSRWKKNY